MIPPETLARLKERTDIVSLIGETVRLVRRGRSFLGLCPFHKEKTPSFHVHPERGFFHCFGCQESGSAIDFVMKTNGLEFIEAVRYLAGKVGVEIQEIDSQENKRARSARDELFAALAVAATFYEGCLGRGELRASRHPLAPLCVEELKSRGMPEEALAKAPSEGAHPWATTLAEFRIGYAPPNWDALSKHFAAQGIHPGVGERAGLLLAGQRGHYDRFRHRLMFAVVDSMGRVVGFSGRARRAPTKEEIAGAGGNLPAYDGDAPAKYINSPESAVFKKGEQLFGLFQAKQGIRTRGEALLVEGNFDVMTLHAAGFNHAIAPLGTAFTSEQAKLAKRFTPRVVVAFDGDGAGRKATKASRGPLRDGGLDARVLVMPQGADPDALLRKEGPVKFEAMLGRSVPLLEYLIEDALDGERFRGASLAERVARVRAVTEILKGEEDPSLRLMAKRYADQLSSKLVIGNAPAEDLRELERMVDEAFRTPDAPASRAVERSASAQPTLDKASLGTLGALIDHPELIAEQNVVEALQAVSGDLALAIVSIREHFVSNDTTKTLSPEFLDGLPPSLREFATRRFAAPEFADLTLARSELLEYTKHLRNLLLSKQIRSEGEQLRKSQSSEDEDAILLQAQLLARRKRGLAEG